MDAMDVFNTNKWISKFVMNGLLLKTQTYKYHIPVIKSTNYVFIFSFLSSRIEEGEKSNGKFSECYQKKKETSLTIPWMSLGKLKTKKQIEIDCFFDETC